MTAIMGSFWFLETKYYRLEQNLNFTHDGLQEMHVEFQKATFRKNTKTGYFQIIASAVCVNVFQWVWAHLFGCPLIFCSLK